jgi:RNA polymerase sigma-32 factor
MGNKTTRALRAVPAVPAPAELEETVELADEIEPIVDEVTPVPGLMTSLPAAPERPIEHASDALGRYMEELRKYPILDRETEHEVALHYEKTQDPDDARRLIGSNLRLVVKLAREYQGASQNLLDLVQEGNLGLVRSLKTYEPSRGIRVSTYASWWIRAYILKYILDNARLVRFGKTEAQRKLFFNLRKAKERLEQAGITADAEAISRTLGVPERDVISMERRLAQPDLSLDAPVDREESDGRSFMDRLESPIGERPDFIAEGHEHREELRRTIAEFANTLSGRDRVIFDRRLYADEPETLQTLADQFGISRERTRQLEQRIVNGLKTWVVSHLDGATLEAIPLAA